MKIPDKSTSPLISIELFAPREPIVNKTLLAGSFNEVRAGTESEPPFVA